MVARRAVELHLGEVVGEVGIEVDGVGAARVDGDALERRFSEVRDIDGAIAELDLLDVAERGGLAVDRHRDDVACVLADRVGGLGLLEYGRVGAVAAVDLVAAAAAAETVATAVALDEVVEGGAGEDVVEGGALEVLGIAVEGVREGGEAVRVPARAVHVGEGEVVDRAGCLDLGFLGRVVGLGVVESSAR